MSNTFKNLKTWEDITISEVKIHDDVWIGLNSIILKGVTIGKGTIVGANSVVSKDLPAFTVCAGAPAKVIKRIENNHNEI